MIIQEEIKVPANAVHLSFETNKCTVVKHHVRQLDQPQSEIISRHPIMGFSDCDNMKNETKNSRKRCNKSRSSSSDIKNSAEETQISPEDLEELRSVYKKCKAVVKKIETKYGHLLNLDESKAKRRKDHSESENVEEKSTCECSTNKKIIFDDEGKEIPAETDLENHICPKKLKRQYCHVEPQNNLQVEYDTTDLTLPEDLQSLIKILRNPDIEITYRNKVIHKMKMMRQQYVDEIRFEKHSLIEKMKSNPDEMLDFKGANLKSLAGYK